MATQEWRRKLQGSVSAVEKNDREQRALYSQYALPMHTKADSKARPTEIPYIPGGGIEPPWLKGNLIPRDEPLTKQVNRPHAAMDYVNTPEVAPPAQTPRLEPSFLFGGPNVETPTANLFDEWWRSTPVTGSASVDAGVSASDGGSIWSDNNTSLQDFGGDTSLGSDLSVDLGSLRLGGDYPSLPEVEVPPPVDEPFNPLSPTTGIPVEPGILPQDNEWTTSPEDRRFLPGSGEPTVQVPRSSSGGNIRNFGGQSFGNQLSLGAYLSTPLEVMRYGGDRYVQGGRVDVARATEYTGGSIEGGREPGTNWGTMTPEQIQAYQETHDNAGNIRPGVAVSPEVRRPEEPEYRDFIDTGLTGGGTRWDPTQGRYVANNNATGAQHSQRAFNNMLMWSQSIPGNVNDTAYSSDEGVTRRYGQIGHLDEFGQYEQTGFMRPGVNSSIENYRGLVYGSQRSTARNIPGRGGG